MELFWRVQMGGERLELWKKDPLALATCQDPSLSSSSIPQLYVGLSPAFCGVVIKQDSHTLTSFPTWTHSQWVLLTPDSGIMEG